MKDRGFNVVVAGLICGLFLIFQVITRQFSGDSNEVRYRHGMISEDMVSSSSFSSRDSDARVRRVFNPDSSLSVPFLDKINQFWHIGGTAEVRNMKSITLTTAGQSGKHGLVLSNGIGDNTITDFEVIVDFKIYGRGSHAYQGRDPKSIIGDGMAVVITPENGFLMQDLVSSFSRKQYEINSGGVNAKNTEMMGLPNNLPGLAVVLDTYTNSYKTDTSPPFVDVIVNRDPTKQFYSGTTDNYDTTAEKLNNEHIKVRRSAVTGDRTKLRILYSETIGFLKVDIQYEQEGSYWIELFQKTGIVLPKNPENGERYIGIAALTGQASETVEIFKVETNEFHWDKQPENQEATSADDNPTEDTYDYAVELQKFLSHELGQRISMEHDEFTRWKIKLSQPNLKMDTPEYEVKPPAKKQGSNSTIKYIAIITFCILIYFCSVYIRVISKHLKRRRRKSRSHELLPT